jgi:[glutamine synthetase] adenylyltransferase / [glutamine synthetase]-adenylyl-L-tyrosine phosphorylase
MQAEQLRQYLDSPERARPLLQSWQVRDAERGWRNLTYLAGSLPDDGLRELCGPLARLLPRCPDPDMALNSLERYLATPGACERLTVLLESRARTLEILLQLFSTSQYFSDLLVANPDYVEMLRVPLRRSPGPDDLREQLQSTVDDAYEDAGVLRAFRRFRQRQVLRIGTNDVIRERSLEEVTRDISRVAEASLQVALHYALNKVSTRFGKPYTKAGQLARCVMLAFGKLGGEELNYSSDIDLMFFYDEEGSTRGARGTSIGNDDYFGRVVSEVVRLLSAHTDQGQAYRVDLRLRPEGHRGPLTRSLASTLAYYDRMGRTWERQALIKVRPVAGDLELGEQFLRAIEPFIYRKYLNFAEINGIKALKRKIEQRTARDGASETEVKTGRGGIRDIEFVIQFLQLLNGGDLSEVRERNTLLAMEALERAGCLTDQEYRVLDDAYRFLRKVEHRLQILFDLQTHRLPERPEELRKLALRMGYTGSAPTTAEPRVRVQKRRRRSDEPPAPVTDQTGPPLSALEAFERDYREKTRATHAILDHLLHQTFVGTEGQPEPEADLILDPDPDAATIQAVLGKYHFRDVQGAYQNLLQLARESVPFLSTRRSRHFLASIAARLLRAVAETPDPDLTLVNLEKVTASIGAKSVLWELFSFNPPSLKLYVDLCAWSTFLTDILINNPGMIDELLDTLVLNQPRTAEELRAELKELCRGATVATTSHPGDNRARAPSVEPILRSFQDKELLRIGVRDILGKDDIRATTAALTDLAEVILNQIVTLQYPPVQKRFGVPYLAEGSRAGQCSRYALLGLGKFGGRELSYHSDLDLILVYEGDGRTGPPAGASRFERFDLTDNFHFFTEVAQRIIRSASQQGPMGRLYQVDMRLRPTGRSGSLVTPLAEFRRYYSGPDRPEHHEAGAQLWERQALTRARVVHGDPDFAREVMSVVEQATYGPRWHPEDAEEILSMRRRLECSRSERDLKRGFGGLVDVEFLVQLFQLKYGGRRPTLRVSNIWKALDALREAKLLTDQEYLTLTTGYRFLLQVQSRLRIVHNRSLDEVPQGADEVEKLARRLGYEVPVEGSAGEVFLADLDHHTRHIRETFLRLLAREREEDQ